MTGRKGRRRFRRGLLALLTLTGTLMAMVAGAVAWRYATADVSTVGKSEFTNELAIPPLAESTVDGDGTRVFNLEMREGEKEFRPGRKTPTWGFNGDYLGPTLRAKRGERVRVNIRNRLAEASTVHWHGMHLPAEMDGGPHQMVPAGGSWTPHWTIDQPAATLWYHPHPHGRTADHVGRGLAGMFILDDGEAAKLPLPKRYGVDDLPLIVQDVAFDGDRLRHDSKLMSSVGFLGDQTMVNGTLTPYRQVRDELVRLRLLNASRARTYTFGFSDDREFSLVATDGGLLERATALNRLTLSPGERAEIVVGFKPGERTVLRSYPTDGGGLWEKRLNGNDDSFDIVQFRAARTLRDSPELPAGLRLVGGKLELPDASDATRGRYFGLSRPGINGVPMDMERINATVTRGTTEIWTLRNQDGVSHNFHVHDVQFRVVEVNGRKPEPHLLGRKDTVYVPDGHEVKIAVRFDGPADPDTPYMYHCHLLMHEDEGMMGQFVVVEPGQTAGRPPSGSGGTGGHHHH